MNVSVVATMGNIDGVFEAFKACTESENYLTVRILKHTVRMLLELILPYLPLNPSCNLL